MSDMSSVTNDIHFSLFKGEPGTRKSTQALTYPKPQYWFSYDKKMNALTIPINKWGIDRKQIHFDDYDDWDAAKKKLESFVYSEGLDASKISCPYKTIIIDSITSFADLTLRQVRKNKSASGKNKKSGESAVRAIGGIDVGDIEDYRAENAAFGELISLLKTIKKIHQIDIILIAHVIRTEQKALDGLIQVTRSIVTEGKKPAARIPAYCDEIYQFGLEESLDANQVGDFILQTQSAGDDFARTTLPLEAKIKLGGKNLYDEIIKPAIEKQKNQ